MALYTIDFKRVFVNRNIDNKIILKIKTFPVFSATFIYYTKLLVHRSLPGAL